MVPQTRSTDSHGLRYVRDRDESTSKSLKTGNSKASLTLLRRSKISKPTTGCQKAEIKANQINDDAPEVVRSSPINQGKRSKPGLDTSLPPIFELSDIFDDIGGHAIQLGFKAYLHHMGSRKLRVVTMCSGTESPLLALEMISDGKSAMYCHWKAKLTSHRSQA
jgi:hypothetical protein